ncbi:hypothetical protein Bca52824_050243 [Brassica carinata]|nr:hypothetical protein Bca52824_050243 [Brassica carinata]
MGAYERHDEDWIHLHSKPKHPLRKHLAEESSLWLRSSHLKRERYLPPNYLAKTPNRSHAATQIKRLQSAYK